MEQGAALPELLPDARLTIDNFNADVAISPDGTRGPYLQASFRAASLSTWGLMAFGGAGSADDTSAAPPSPFNLTVGAAPPHQLFRALRSVGPNATLVADDLESAIRELKAERDGEIEVAGPDLAHSLTELGLIDEHRIYVHPVVLGHGQPYFAGPRPRLLLMTN